MTFVNYLIDPPLAVFAFFLLLLFSVIRKYIQKDHFYTLIVSILFSFLLAEGVCRLLNIGNLEVAVWKEELAKEGSYAYKPNGKLLYRYPDNPRGYFNKKNEVSGNINSKGFRGPEKTFKKTNGIVRVAFLGDSFTLGIGVKDNDTLPASFEHAINFKYSNIEALNFGITNSATDRQIKLLREYVIKFNPDIVVVVLFLNDANRIGTMNFLSRPKVLAKVRKYSFITNAIIGRIEKYLLHRVMIHHYQDGYVEGRPGWEAVKNAIGKGQSLSEEYDFKFIVAVYPVLIQLDESYPFSNIHKTIEEFCISKNILCVDFFDAFEGKNDSDLWVHSTDQHPNEVANRIAGAKLAEYFDNKGLIKRNLSNDREISRLSETGLKDLN